MAHKVILPPKKNYIPQFLKQRDINSYYRLEIHSLMDGIFYPAFELLPPCTKDLYLCTDGPLPSLWPPPPSQTKCTVYLVQTVTGFIRGILRGVRYAKSLRVLFLHRRSPSWTTLVLYSRAVFIFNEPTKCAAVGGGGCWVVLYTIFCRIFCTLFYRYRIYKSASSPQAKMASKYYI